MANRARLATIEDMDDNPYEPPHHESTQKKAYTTTAAVLLFSLVIVFSSTIGGCSAGVGLGIVALSVMPRTWQPMCGNSVIEPMCVCGLIIGFVGGLVLVVYTVLANTKRVARPQASEKDVV